MLCGYAHSPVCVTGIPGMTQYTTSSKPDDIDLQVGGFEFSSENEVHANTPYIEDIPCIAPSAV